MPATRYHCLFLSLALFWLGMLAGSGGLALAGPYSDAVTDGIAYNNSGILGWATDCTGQRSAQASFGTWEDALGPAPGIINDVVSLGEGGYAILTFDLTIADGAGPDLAVFENTLQVGNNVFAELAFVEVSSDGIDFVRFSGHSLTLEPVALGGVIDPTNVHNFPGKHVNNQGTWLGTPFDLAELNDHPAVQSGSVNLSNINYVKIIDISGDGLTLDAEQRPIYDPYPTDSDWGTGGFDLDAVAVLNTYEPTALLGDVNDDGFVGGDDLSIILTNWGLSGMTRQQGDLSGDNFVGGDDYSEVLTYWGTGISPETISIPEPTSLLSLLSAVVLCGLYRLPRKLHSRLSPTTQRMSKRN